MKRLFIAIFTVLVSICTVGASSVEVRSARALYAQKDYAGALEVLKKAVKKDSKDVEALFALSVLYYELGDFDNAFKYIDKTIKYGKNDPNLPVYYGSKASFYLESHDTVAALKEYDTAISLDPNNKDVLLDRAIMFRKMKEYDKSTAELKKVIAMEPNHQAYRGVAQNEYLKKNYKAAADWYTTTLENFPNSHYTYLLRGNTYLKMKEYDKAFDDILSTIPTKYYEEAAYLLNELVDSTSFDNVMAKLKDTVAKVPSELISGNVIPNLYYNYGRVYEAIDIYSASLHAAGANNYLSNLYIADCYSLAGEYDKALAYCDSAYAVDPKKMRSWYQKMKIYTAMGQYDKALEYTDILLEENPASKRTLLEKRSDIKYFKGDLEGALADLEMIHRSANVNDLDKLKKASLLHKMGRQKDAETIVNALLGKKDFASGPFSKFAYAILGQKDKVKSLSDEEVKKGFDKGLYNIACAYGVIGEYTEGLAYLRMAFEKKTKGIFSALIDVDMIEYRKLPEFWDLVNEFRPKKK